MFSLSSFENVPCSDNRCLFFGCCKTRVVSAKCPCCVWNNVTHTTLRYCGKMKLWVLNTIAAEATGVTVARHNLSFTEVLCSSATNADNLA
jgi:hypothetical protein